MATYYVRPDGNNANAGTGPATNQAWQTLTKALGATGIASGDTVYIAPGSYNESVTIGMTSATATTSVIGDPTASQFMGVAAGPVYWTVYNTLGTSPTLTSVTATSKDFLSFQNIYFDAGKVAFTTSKNLTFINCQFIGCADFGTNVSVVNLSSPTSTALNATFSKCTFSGADFCMILTGQNVSDATSITNCLFFGSRIGASTINLQCSIYNCTFAGIRPTVALGFTGGSASFLSTVRNNLFFNCGQAIYSDTSNRVTQSHNRFISCGSTVANVPTDVTSTTTFSSGLIFPYQLQNSLGTFQMFSSILGGPNTSYGTATGAPASDMYGVTWTGTSPDAGSATYRNLSNVTPYVPTERNASTITIAPGSTSQSIELYLGATGLTASTAGLSAYYNRTRSADVQINLQARNITQNWTSGGFAEVNPNTMPGVYRLDIPNEALAAGADDVTVVVRGASGTNGAVMSIKLSSGGLTTAQTAAAVWDTLTSAHTTHGTYGWNVLRADQQSKQGLVTLHQSGGLNRVDADIHAIVNDTAAATALKGALLHDGTGYVDSDVVRVSTSTAAADELEGALLHNGTDYIDSNLVGGNSTRVFVGRFQMTQTGTTQGDIIEAFTTDTPAFELQLFDGDNNLVPVTGATLGLRILDVTSTVVETGTPTIEYGTGGIVRWTAPGTYLSIGCPAGMYRMFVDRTVSGTTTTFGPLQIKVQVQ